VSPLVVIWNDLVRFIDAAHQVTWCGIERLCISSGESFYDLSGRMGADLPKLPNFLAGRVLWSYCIQYHIIR
jgi:hypothetical protein